MDIKSIKPISNAVATIMVSQEARILDLKVIDEKLAQFHEVLKRGMNTYDSASPWLVELLDLIEGMPSREERTRGMRSDY